MGSKQKKTCANIKEIVDVTFDKENGLFKNKENEYILMINTVGTNIFGFKDADKEQYIDAVENLFNQMFGVGEIYSYAMAVNIEEYLQDIEERKNALDITNEQDAVKNQMLDDEQMYLSDLSANMEMVDRRFIIVIKNKDIFKLRQLGSQIVSTLNMYQYTYIMDMSDMVGVVYNYYNPYDNKLLEKFYPDLDKDDLMDFLYPTELSLIDKGFFQVIEMDGMYYRTRYVSSYVGMPAFAFLSYLTEEKNIDFAMHYQPTADAAVDKQISKNIRSINNQLDKVKDAADRMRLVKERSEYESMLQNLTMYESTPMVFSVIIRLRGHSQEKLLEQSNQLDKKMMQYGIRFRDGVCQSLELFKCASPLGYNSLDDYMKPTTADTLAWGYPFVFQSLYDSKVDDLNGIRHRMPPIYLGQTEDGMGNIFYDNFIKQDDRANYNEFVVGQSGMGKTFLLMKLIYYRYSRGYKQYIIDVEGKELNKLTHYLKGENINCANGDKGRINPMHIRFQIPDSDNKDEGKVPLSEIYPLAEHIRFLRTFLNTYKGDNDDIRLLHMNIIEDAIIDVYKSMIDVDFNTSADVIVNRFGNDDYPIISDVCDQIQIDLEKLMKERQSEVEIT